jgi:Rap1a immunity proteins
MWARRDRAIRAALISALLMTLDGRTDAKVGEFTGDDYLRQCSSTDPNWKPKSNSEQEMAVYCIGYIDAAVTFIVLMDGQGYCLPTGATPQDVLRTTVTFMQAHPEQKSYLFGSVMMAAMLDRWPCRK